MNFILYGLLALGIIAFVSVAVILAYIYMDRPSAPIDADLGIITMIGVSARGTAQGAAVCNTPMKFQFFDVKNPDGGFNRETCVYTIPADGLYHVYAEMFIYDMANNTWTDVGVSINNLAIYDSVTTFKQVSDGDYIFNKKIQLKKGDQVGIMLSCIGVKMNMERLKFIVTRT